MNLPDNCLLVNDSRHRLVLQDVKSKAKPKPEYRVENASRYPLKVYEVEGCLIKGNDQKQCDRLLWVAETQNCYFIELKGKKILDAVRQIDHSIQQIKPPSEVRVNGRIVCSKINAPDIKSIDYKRLEVKLKQTGGNLLKGSQTLIEKF